MAKVELYQADLHIETQPWPSEYPRIRENPLDDILETKPDYLRELNESEFPVLGDSRFAQRIETERANAAYFYKTPERNVRLYTIRHISLHDLDSIWRTFSKLTQDDLIARLNRRIFPSTRLIGVRADQDPFRIRRSGSRSGAGRQHPISLLRIEAGIEDTGDFTIPNLEMPSRSEINDGQIYTAFAAKLALGEVIEGDTGQPITTPAQLRTWLKNSHSIELDTEELRIRFLKLLNHETIWDLKRQGILTADSHDKSSDRRFHHFVEDVICWLVALSLESSSNSRTLIYPYPFDKKVGDDRPSPAVLKLILLGHYAYLKQLPYFCYGGISINVQEIREGIIRMNKMLEAIVIIHMKKSLGSHFKRKKMQDKYRVSDMSPHELYKAARENNLGIATTAENLHGLLGQIEPEFKRVLAELYSRATTIQKAVWPRTDRVADDIRVLREIIRSKNGGEEVS